MSLGHGLSHSHAAAIKAVLMGAKSLTLKQETPLTEAMALTEAYQKLLELSEIINKILSEEKTTQKEEEFMAKKPWKKKGKK